MTARRLARGLALLTIFLPSFAWCLGLGDIKVDTALNQPLRAEIRLLSVEPDEVDNLRVSLASQETFDRVGIERPFVLSQLEFKPVPTENSGTLIEVTSKQPMREPFLNFLVEVQWPNGRLLREYTVLLDPPVMMDQHGGIITKAPAVAPQAKQAPERATSDALQGVTKASNRDSTHAESQAGIASTQMPADDAVYPQPSAEKAHTASLSHEVAPGDTLGEIAQHYRPDADVSLSRMMMAILRTNEDAFFQGNINNLKTGIILRMPADWEIAAISEEEAVAEVARQNSLWREYRAQLAAAVPSEQIEESVATVSASEIAGKQTDTAASERQDSGSRDSIALDAKNQDWTSEGRLKIMAPDHSSTNAQATNAGGNIEQVEFQPDDPLAQELLVQELAESRRVEIESLQSRVAELESMIAKQQRIISLQSEALANLQQRLNGVDAPRGREEPIAHVDLKVAVPTEATADTAAADEPATPVTSQPVTIADTTAPQKPAGEAVAAAPSSISLIDDLLASPSMLVGLGVGATLLLGLVWMVVRRAASNRAATIDLASYEGDGNAVDARVAAAPIPETIDAMSREVTEASQPAVQSAAATAALDGGVGAVASAAAEQNQDADTPTSPVSDDTLAEADVYIAYGLHQQAEDLLQEAIRRNPNRDDYRVKLLEVYYVGRNRAGFDAHAQALYESAGRKAGGEWDRVVTMGRDLSPYNPLFRNAAEDRMSAPVQPETADVGARAGSQGQTSTVVAELELDLSAADPDQAKLTRALAEEAQEEESAIAHDSEILEIGASDLDATLMVDLPAATSTSTLQMDERALDFDLSDLDIADGADATAEIQQALSQPRSEAVQLGNDAPLDNARTLTMPRIASPEGAQQVENTVTVELQIEKQATALVDETVLKLDDGLDAESLEALLGEDEVSTKLDLAKAYIDLGDSDGAISTLEEVLQEGDDNQRKEAEVLMRQIA